MSGLYIHIPFCRKACRYCDFHFTVSLNLKEEILRAIASEIVQRSESSKNDPVSTVYFGGGTPSVLEIIELENLLRLIYSVYSVKDGAEITLEANPDDLTPEYLKNLRALGINRLSIGIQSFYDDDLTLMRRSHSAYQGITALENAVKAGFSNISGDLIYGLPGMTEARLEENLRRMTEYSIPHISAYHLTYEPGTVFDHWRKKGRLMPLDEEESISQFLLLRKMLLRNGYDHYEISNYAKPGYISIHNSNYWKQLPYIGVGPSAHSYTRNSRRWNFSSNKRYMENINKGEAYYEEEELDTNDLFNEYIMTSFRTKWGISVPYIKQKFGDEMLSILIGGMQKYIEDNLIEQKDATYILTERGLFLSDYIISDLFI